jgi:hypothetical protein
MDFPGHVQVIKDGETLTINHSGVIVQPQQYTERTWNSRFDRSGES